MSPPVAMATVSDGREDILHKISEQGIKVRTLKTEKANKVGLTDMWTIYRNVMNVLSHDICIDHYMHSIHSVT